MRTIKYDFLEPYIEKVYGYAINHTYSREEADELAQEILYTTVRELPKLRDKNKFEPWLWGIANNITKSFRRNLGKQRAMYSYDTLEHLSYEDEYFDDQEEIYDSLRTKIAMLSAIYRDIIVLHYYDGLSTKTISEKLKIPEGTVRWRLTEARRKLKKECAEMRETALRPVKMKLDIYGSGNYNGTTIPFPTVYINDALSQNILYDGRFFVTVPFFTKTQKAEFDSIADKYLAPLMPEYSELVNKFISGYKKLFPKHLNDDADRMCQQLFMGMYAVIIEYAQRIGAIKMPSPGCYCDVMIQYKES